MNLLDSCLKHAASAAISGHVRPDGDCAGSCLAVYNYIRDNYPWISVDLYLEPVPEKFLFLKNADRIRTDPEAAGDAVYDLFIALDCGDRERLGAAGRLFENARHTLCVDHHVTNQNFADDNFVSPDASSASELVYQLIDPGKITKEIAECLYLGIVHDTGVFQYSCTSPGTMEIAGQLMARGINYPKIVDETYFIRTFAQQKIWGKAMMESTLHLGGKCICAVVTKEDMEAFHVKPEELDGLVSQLRSTAGVEAAVFLYETDTGYKISLRSAEQVDVAEIAMEFGGGGHVRAAGASVESKDPAEILKRVLGKIRRQLPEGVCITES